MRLKDFNFKEILVLAVFGVVFLLSLFMLIIGTVGASGKSLTGHVTETATVSNVTIAKYLAIDMSTNLTEGIMFGSVNTLPATNVNATHNYDDASSGTSMFLNVSADSNTNVDFCIKANAAMADPVSGGVLGIGNETYANSTTTDIDNPGVGSELALTTEYAKSGVNVTIGSASYYRFWLDVPVSVQAGTYNNTVWFKGIETTGSC